MPKRVFGGKVNYDGLADKLIISLKKLRFIFTEERLHEQEFSYFVIINLPTFEILGSCTYGDPRGDIELQTLLIFGSFGITTFYLAI